MSIMHVRIKRKHQTIFLPVKNATTFGEAKIQISKILNGSIEADKIKFLSSDESKTYEDKATFGDQSVKNDDIVLMVYQQNSGTFEKVNLVKPSEATK